MSLYHEYFYHKCIRNYTIILGTLFNDISIQNKNSSNETIQTIKVPIAYGPKSKFIERKNKDDDFSRKPSINIPRIGFELLDFSFDSSRKINTFAKNSYFYANDKNKLNVYNSPIPYNFNYAVYILTKNQEQMNQIVEQILPFFAPDLTVPVNLISGEDSFDIPIVLSGISIDDNYEGSFDNTRRIIYNLGFTVKGFLFPPVKQEPIIKISNTQIFTTSSKTEIYGESISNTEFTTALNDGDSDVRYKVRPGLLANGEPTTNSSDTVSLSEIGINDDYGIIEENE